MEELNFISLPVVAVLSLVGGPLLLRRAGYPAGKTVFGTLTAMAVLLGIWGVVSAIQNRLGLVALPLGWLVPALAAVAAWRWRDRL
ncbi:MAG TPA: hypothetical protein VK196_12055 [Magnetospirillum sp.]|nr:hypothetical protein [Magnetospirillum sp.]